MIFRNPAAEFVTVRTYNRYVDELGRRETWRETVRRYFEFIEAERGHLLPDWVLPFCEAEVLAMNVMPSMRALWAAGPAARADNTTMYNCAFAAVDSVESFSEALYVLMCGTGFGFRVLPEDVEKLPIVPEHFLGIEHFPGDDGYLVEDSRAGWADSVKQLLTDLYSGRDRHFAFHEIRPRGATLKTMGGRASGPEPLIRLHDFIRETFHAARGRKLTTLECHDIMNVIAEIVVVGGVRRSSEISLSAVDDELMRHAKDGEYPWHRAMANNSAVYTERPDEATFWKEWWALAESGRGERGIFNLGAARETAPSRRTRWLIEGTNPCGEIALRSKQFCNLSEVVVRPDDDYYSLRKKVRAAAWIGVIQSTFTHFPYLRSEWTRNCNQERLLGVSLTGQMDAPHLMTPRVLSRLKTVAVATAEAAAEMIGIPMPAAVTCVKPSGTVSQVVDAASGIHPRFAPYYIRRYRISSTDPLFHLMRASGVKFYPEVGQRPADLGEEWTEAGVQTWVCEFPVASPEGSVTRHDLTAIEQLEHYLVVQENWCEHNASMTVYVSDDEWEAVGAWVYEHFDRINGVSFLPKTDHLYALAPYEEICRDEYEYLVERLPEIDYSRLAIYETEDQTTAVGSYACVGGSCELS